MFNLFSSPEKLIDECIDLMQEYSFLFYFYLKYEYEKRYEKDTAALLAAAVVSAITFMPIQEKHKQLIEHGLVGQEINKLTEYKELIIPYSYFVKLRCTALSLKGHDRRQTVSVVTDAIQEASVFGIVNKDVFEATKNLIPKHFLREAKIYLCSYQKIFNNIPNRHIKTDEHIGNGKYMKVNFKCCNNCFNNESGVCAIFTNKETAIKEGHILSDEEHCSYYKNGTLGK